VGGLWQEGHPSTKTGVLVCVWRSSFPTDGMRSSRAESLPPQPRSSAPTTRGGWWGGRLGSKSRSIDGTKRTMKRAKGSPSTRDRETGEAAEREAGETAELAVLSTGGETDETGVWQDDESGESAVLCIGERHWRDDNTGEIGCPFHWGRERLASRMGLAYRPSLLLLPPPRGVESLQ